MSAPGHEITNVSDTGRWTALHRATEMARPDALFRDPLAGRLAGDHGRAIVASVPRSTRNGWWLVARTKIIDDAFAEAIADGCDRVLNLAAGLDTRPYRLELPPRTDVGGGGPAEVARGKDAVAGRPGAALPADPRRRRPGRPAGPRRPSSTMP